MLARGNICCKWHKLFVVQEALLWKPGDHINDMDIECCETDCLLECLKCNKLEIVRVVSLTFQAMP